MSEHLSDMALSIGAVAVMINATMFAIMPVFIFCLVRYPGFRSWIINMIEDGDQTPHKADAKDAVVLFFAYVTFWVMINVVFGMMAFEKDWLHILIELSAFLLALIGINKFVGQKQHT